MEAILLVGMVIGAVVTVLLLGLVLVLENWLYGGRGQ